jgi:serine protease
MLRNANSAAAVKSQVESLGGKVVFSHPATGFVLVSGISSEAAQTLGASSAVQSIAQDVAFNVDTRRVTGDAASDVAQSVANPAAAVFYAFQWDMRLIKADAAWAAGKLGSPAVTAAIIDSGIDYTSFDLNGLVDLSRSTSFVPEDDSIQANFLPLRDKSDDFNGHGTNVATQVSSTARVFAGVTSKTRLISVKALDWDGNGFLGRSLAGVLWAADHGANVANMSIGGAFDKAGAKGLGSLINAVMNYASKSGMLVVVAAGNESANLDADGNIFNTYCDAAHVICVSAVGPVNGLVNPTEFAFYSNYGRSSIAVAAPGGNANLTGALSARPWGADFASWVWSMCARNSIAAVAANGTPTFTVCTSGTYTFASIGTSQASPHVAGLAALLMADGSSARSVKQQILKTADDLGQPGTDPLYGRGLINVARAAGL